MHFYYLCHLNKWQAEVFFKKSDLHVIFFFLKHTFLTGLFLLSFIDNCNGPLVSTLPHSSFQSSTQSSVSYAAYNAKLNRRDGEYKLGCSCIESILLYVSRMRHPLVVPAVPSEPKPSRKWTMKRSYEPFL